LIILIVIIILTPAIMPLGGKREYLLSHPSKNMGNSISCWPFSDGQTPKNTLF
jgi:hypothetical protein